MKYYLKFTQLTILQLMAILASVGIIMTVVFQHYEHRKLRNRFDHVIKAVAPYKRAVQACIERKANVSACGTPEKNGIPKNFNANPLSRGFIHSIQVKESGKIIARSQGISLNGINMFSYELIPSIQKNGQILWEVNKNSPQSCTQHHLC